MRDEERLCKVETSPSYLVVARWCISQSPPPLRAYVDDNGGEEKQDEKDHLFLKPKKW